MLVPIIVLAVFGIVMLCIEVVLPGAIIGIIGGGLIIASLVLVFISPSMQDYGMGAQVAIAFGIVTATVISFLTWMRYFHKTIVGRRLILKDTVGDDHWADEPQSLSTLAGKTGVAQSNLRPTGTIKIDGKQYEAQSSAGFVERGAAIRVSKVEGTMVTVVPIAEEAENAAGRGTTETADTGAE